MPGTSPDPPLPGRPAGVPDPAAGAATPGSGPAAAGPPGGHHGRTAPVVDYLVARHGPPPPVGIAYDYLLGGDGLFVAAESPVLRVRVPLARCAVRGLPPLYAACALAHGRVPLALWEAILAAAVRAHAAGREVLLAVRHEPGAGYRLECPPQIGAADRVVYRRRPDTLLEVHSHGPLAARFSPRDDADEQRLGLFGVLGRLGGPRPEVRLRAGAFGYFLPLPWEAVFAGDPADRHPFRDAGAGPPDPRDPQGPPAAHRDGRAAPDPAAGRGSPCHREDPAAQEEATDDLPD